MNKVTLPLRYLLWVCTVVGSLLVNTQVLAQGKLELIRVHGPSLEGNLGGDDATRDVYVYLPQGYAENSDAHFPVLYFLHGYSVGAQFYVETVLNLPASVDQAMADGALPAIMVFPDANSVYSGSMYANSPTTGNWETYIAEDLVSYIDSHYRTLAARGSRGLSGHSMGGYGALKIAMHYPQVFGSLYAMSSCCLLNQAPSQEAVLEQEARMAQGPLSSSAGFANVLQAQAAAFAPNPQNPPYYFDWPFANGVAQPLVANKWITNSPLIYVDQYVAALQQYRAIMLDVGDQDTLEATNTQLDAAMTRLGIAHQYEVYEGDHTNRVGARFIAKVLPFFKQHLEAK